jgi:hypothetical protein
MSNLKLILSPLLILLLLLPSIPLIANERETMIKEQFSKLRKSSRGPFGPIALQHASRRVPPRGNRIGSGFLFQAAFRNSTAVKLLKQDFYAGNLFTTNYFHLYAKHVMHDQDLRFFSIDQEQLLGSGAEMVKEAALIAKHMLVERFYLNRHPGSTYTKSFARRGVSGTEYETRYYQKYLRLFSRDMERESGRLLAFLLQREWNLVGDFGGVSLRRLRGDIDKIYKKCKWGCSSRAKTEIFAIRGVIHNSMSITVVAMIDKFLAKNSNDRMEKLRSDIVRYYTINPATILKFAQSGKRNIPIYLVDTLKSLVTLSKLEQMLGMGPLLAAAAREYVKGNNAEINHLVIMLSTYIHTTAEQLYRQESQLARKLIPTLVDTLYAQGLVTRREHHTLRDKLQLSGSASESVQLISSLPRTIYQRLSSLLAPAINDWSILDDEVSVVIDDTLKASPVSLLDLMITDVRREANKGQDYMVQTAGVTFGYLKFISRDDVVNKSDRFIALEKRDIPIFEVLPLYLAVTAGIITEEYQTELSHVKLKSDARGTPNVYYQAIRQDTTLARLIKSEALVRMELTAAGDLSIVSANISEAERFWSEKRPTAIGELALNIKENRVRSTREVGFLNSDSIGAKAANYAELGQLLGEEVVLEGLTIPFFYYQDFLERNPAIKSEVESTLADRDGKFFSDRVYRNQVLSSWRKKMRSTESQLNPQLVTTVKEWIAKSYSGKNVRFRSSTNAEDLANFNGAGLYSSTSYKPTSTKKTVERALKKVWASIWNLRAFDERELYQIDHLKVAMGMLLSPGFPAQEGEGVAVSRNLKRPELGRAVYFNILAGEDHSVTNPTSGVTPDELLVYYDDGMRVDYLNISNQSTDGKPVLGDERLGELTKMMVQANHHFAQLYDEEGNADFALDFEFKIDDEYSADGSLKIQLKQARPYITE